MARLAMAAGVIVILCLAGWLRFAGLADRPLHCDEGTNARILADRLETGTYVFNPAHFHGPLLSLAAMPLLRCRGEVSWQTLTKGGLRLTPALGGLLTVLLALGLGRVGRAADGVAAAAFLATSPLLVYYSRMAIHEPLFVLAALITLIALKALLQRPTLWHAAEFGVGAGLMAATRETVVLSLVAWAIGAVIWLVQSHPHDTPVELARRCRPRYAALLLLALAIALAIVVVTYSNFGRHPAGVIDFFRAYFVYDTVAGHDKPLLYYLELLLWPKQRAGVWWCEAGVLLFALYGYFRSGRGGRQPAVGRFLVHAGVIHLAIYSLIAYKTPWLACVGWMHLCLAAGIGAVRLLQEGRGWRRLPAIVVVALILLWQGTQSRQAIGRLASDGRNPYAYVPTSNDVERMAAWLEELRLAQPALKAEAVAVVGSFYWPLPWYLRGFDQVGYWDALPEDAATRPLLLLLPTATDWDPAALAQTHALFPRGLRHETPVTVAIRTDIWEAQSGR